VDPEALMIQRVYLCQRCFVASEEAAVAWVDEMVDANGAFQYIDKVGSVSGLGRDGTPVDFDYVPDHNDLFGEDPHGW